MIKLKDLTPEVYYKESRDFQFIGRLFDVVLNSVKTEVDLMYNIPLSNDSDEKLLELMALTLGFKPIHQYNTKQLRAICKAFPEILRNKGSIKSIIIACNALFNAAGAEQVLDYDFTKGSNNTELNIYVPQDFKDITVISDLLTYTLPAGMSCNIIRELRLSAKSFTELETTDQITIYEQGDATEYTKNDYQLYSNKVMSQLVKLTSEPTNIVEGVLNTTDAKMAEVKDNPGFIMNSTLYTIDNPTFVDSQQIKKEGE
jgi:hypothetical protein